MPEIAQERRFTHIIGTLDRRQGVWDIAIVGAEGGTAIVRGKAGQAFDPVLAIAERGVSVAQEVAS